VSDIQEVVGLASKVTWGQRSLSGGGPNPCSMRLWDVDVKPRSVSRHRGFSVIGGLAKADLKALLDAALGCYVKPPDRFYHSLFVGKHSSTRVNTSIYNRCLISDDSDYSSESPRDREFVTTSF
jgi:hypothetical protein